jgi:hypothetical protein
MSARRFERGEEEEEEEEEVEEGDRKGGRGLGRKWEVGGWPSSRSAPWARRDKERRGVAGRSSSRKGGSKQLCESRRELQIMSSGRRRREFGGRMEAKVLDDGQKNGCKLAGGRNESRWAGAVFPAGGVPVERHGWARARLTARRPHAQETSA